MEKWTSNQIRYSLCSPSSIAEMVSVTRLAVQLNKSKLSHVPSPVQRSSASENDPVLLSVNPRLGAAVTHPGVVGRDCSFSKPQTEWRYTRQKPRQRHKTHSGSIANVSVIKVLLVLPKVISLAARSHLARDGIRGLLWALNMMYPMSRSVTFGCLFRSCLFQITCYVFL